MSGRWKDGGVHDWDQIDVIDSGILHWIQLLDSSISCNTDFLVFFFFYTFLNLLTVQGMALALQLFINLINLMNLVNVSL